MELKYEGKAKKIFSLSETEVLIQFKDDITAFDGEKKDTLSEKGRINAEISAHLFSLLSRLGVATHFIRKETDIAHICKACEIVQVEVVCRNYATGSFCRRYGVPEGPLEVPIIEFFYKSDEQHDPLLSEGAISALKLATINELRFMKYIGLQVNNILKEFFASLNLSLLDFKLEFGRDPNGNLLLADELTPDSMRLRSTTDINTIFDKDRFRKGKGKVIEYYKEVLKRIQSKIDVFKPTKTKQKVTAIVRLKPTIIDPAGNALLRTINKAGYNFIEEVRMGKVIDFNFHSNISSSNNEWFQRLGKDLLTNPLIETFEFRYE